MAQTVFSNPVSRTTRYVGIKPPLNIMVKTIMKMNSPRPISFLRLSGNASSTLSAKLMAVPTVATKMVTPKALGMVSIPNSIR
ncbi:hypothetical protein D3C76_1446660 [compost metagenome]